MVDYVKVEQDDSQEKQPGKKKKSIFSLKKILIIVLVFFLLSSLISTMNVSMSDKIAVVPIKGAIMTESSTSLYGSSISSRSISETLYSLASDETVKSILLDINSPGGSPVASEEISTAVEFAKSQNKTVYALVNDVGASGGFWVAVSADKVYASKMSTLGSIGVTSAGLSFEEFIEENNISYRKQTAGEYKDMGSIFRAPTEIEQEKIQVLLDEIHSEFISHVAVSRNLSYDYVANYSTGEIFLGSQAKELGFIDEFGGYNQVIETLKSESESEPLVITYGPQETLLDVIGISGVFSSQQENIVMLK